MEQSLSWEADSHLIFQEILCCLFNPKVNCRVHNPDIVIVTIIVIIIQILS
jgi:hypothetical protein